MLLSGGGVNNPERRAEKLRRVSDWSLARRDPGQGAVQVASSTSPGIYSANISGLASLCHALGIGQP